MSQTTKIYCLPINGYLQSPKKKVDSAKIPEQVKNLVISIGNSWAKYTSDAFDFLLRDAGVLIEGSTHFKEG
jgi:hypothetical protein